MHIHEHTMLIIAKERMADAARSAELVRPVRLDQAPRRWARVRLGVAMIRLGHWLIGGQPSGIPVGFARKEC